MHRRARLMALTLLLLLLSLLQPAFGAGDTYYVGAGGTDSNGCPSMRNQPTVRRQTITGGIGCLGGGDTLVIGNGTYTECINDTVPSGSAGQPTTIRAENPPNNPPGSVTGTRNVILNGNPGNCAGAMIRVGTNAFAGARSYITYDGLYLQVDPDTVGSGIVQYGGVDQTDGTHHISWLNMELSGTLDTGSTSNFGNMLGQTGNGHDMILRGSYFHDFGLHRINPGVGQGCVTYAMYVSGWNNIIENNEFTHGCGFGIHGYSTGSHFENNIIRNNYFHDMGAAAVMMCGSPTPNYVYNNIVARTGVLVGQTQAGSGQWGGITTGPSCSGARPNHNYIYNNTMVNVGGSGELTCIALSTSGDGVSASDNKVRNNICVSTQGTTEGITDNSSKLDGPNFYDQNLCATSGTNCRFVADPQFVKTMPSASMDYRAAGIRPEDFQLQSGSPAIGAGQCDVSSMLTDFGGQPRPAACQLGAWETGTPSIILPGQNGSWIFDDTSGATVPDQSGANHPLTLTGGTSLVTGKTGTLALACDGVTGRATTSGFNFATYSYMLWVKGTAAPSTTQLQQPIINGGGPTGGQQPWGFSWGHPDPNFRQSAVHHTATNAWIAAQIPGPPLQGGIWYHIAATYDGTLLRVYLDGVPKATVAATAPYPITASDPFTLCWTGGTAKYPGAIDDVKVYNTVLTQADIAAEVGSGPPPRSVRHGRIVGQ